MSYDTILGLARIELSFRHVVVKLFREALETDMKFFFKQLRDTPHDTTTYDGPRSWKAIIDFPSLINSITCTNLENPSQCRQCEMPSNGATTESEDSQKSDKIGDS